MGKENYLKPEEKEKKYNFLYVVHPKNIEDTQKIYDVLDFDNTYKIISELGKDFFIEISSKYQLKTLKEKLSQFEIESLKSYNLVKDWNCFEGKKITKEDRETILARLIQLSEPNTSVPRVLNILCFLGTIGLLACAAMMKNLYFGIGSLLWMVSLIGIKYAFKKNEAKFQKLKDIVNEPWIVCECDVATVDTIVHRGIKDETLNEYNFRISQGNNCVDHLFTGLSLEIGNKVRLFIRENKFSNPLTEDKMFLEGEQIYFFNESYLIIPKDFRAKEIFKHRNVKEEN